MLEDLHARIIHRRLKARFSPTILYTVIPSNAPAAPTDQPAPNPVDPAPPASSTPPPLPLPSDPLSSSASSAPSSSASSTSGSATTSSSPSTASAPFTSSSSPPTTSSTPEKAPTQSVPPASHVPSHSSISASLTHSLSHSATITASSTAVPDTAGTLHAPVIVGVVVAALAGVIGIVFAATYFMRRSRNNSDDMFRRQSMVLPDEPEMRPRGTTPRPPSIIEQHLSQGPVPQFGDRSFYGGGGPGAYYGQSSFAPGEIVSMPPQAWSPATPESARPFYNPMGDSPMGSPVSPAPYDSFYNAQGQLVRQPSNGAGVMLNRQPSPGPQAMFNRQPSPGPQAMMNRQPSPGPQAMLSRQPSNGAVMHNRQTPNGANQMQRQVSNGAQVMSQRQPSNGPARILTHQINNDAHMILDQPPSATGIMSPISPVPMAYVPPHHAAVPVQKMQYAPPVMLSDAHYVDLSRSSVSPFQAAQYAEISSKLQTIPPKPLPSPEVAAVTQEILSSHDHTVPIVTEPRPLNVAASKRSSDPDSPRESYAVTIEDEDLPMPSPSFTGKARIDSTPPTLPEILLPNRSFSPVTLDFPNAPSSVHATPSPLNTSFTLPSPPPEVHFSGSSTPATPSSHAASPALRPMRNEPPAKRPDTVYTLYDDDDAYAGI